MPENYELNLLGPIALPFLSRTLRCSLKAKSVKKFIFDLLHAYASVRWDLAES